MKVITLWQPGAIFIAFGWKKIETRTHNNFSSLLNQTIGIHAGLKWDNEWSFLSGNYLSGEQYSLIRKMQQNKNIPFGEIICTAKVYDFCHLTSADSKKALIDCRHSNGRYGLFLDEIIKLEKPIKIKGKQGIWNYEGEI